MTALKLKEFRLKHKMTQAEVAEKLNMSQQGYFKWEKGITFPNPEKIVELCKIFKCSPNDLFGFKGVHIITAEEVF